MIVVTKETGPNEMAHIWRSRDMLANTNSFSPRMAKIGLRWCASSCNSRSTTGRDETRTNTKPNPKMRNA